MCAPCSAGGFCTDGQFGTPANVSTFIGQAGTTGLSDGTGTTVVGAFMSPSGVAFDTVNNCLWITDAGGHRIRRVARDAARLVTVAGSTQSTGALRPCFVPATTPSGLTLSGSNTVATLTNSNGGSWNMNAIMQSPVTAADGTQTTVFKMSGTAAAIAMLGMCSPSVTTLSLNAFGSSLYGVWIYASSGGLYYPPYQSGGTGVAGGALGLNAQLTLVYNPSAGSVALV